MTPDDFWNSSLKEIIQIVDGYLFRAQVEFRMGVAGAWMAAAWSRSKRMPPLERVMKKLEKADDKVVDAVTQREDMLALAKDMAPEEDVILDVESKDSKDNS
jgi:hypothetical protein